MIPATLMYIYGVCGAVGGLLTIGLRVWVAATGKPELRAGDDIPPAWLSLVIFCMCICGFVAATYWMRGYGKAAILATLVTFALHAMLVIWAPS